jgi:hypothetical protein
MARGLLLLVFCGGAIVAGGIAMVRSWLDK